jgi:two-component system sensor histidine kinase BaeS
LKLVHKLFLIVILPIVFECAFVGTFFLFEHLASEANAKYQHAHDIAMLTDDITKDVYDMASACGFASIGKPEVFLQRARDAGARIDVDVEQLMSLTSADGAVAADARRLADAAVRCKEMAAPYLVSKPTLMGFSSYHQLFKVTGDLVAEHRTIREQNGRNLQAASRNVERWRQWIKIFVIGGLVASLGLTVFVVRLVHKHLVGRLASALANIAKVKEGKQLGTAVPGNDEIAQLDEFVHEMADSLQQAREARKQLTRMITHDLRAPLTNMGFLLGMISEGAFDASQDKLKLRATGMEPELDRINRLIEELLDLETMDAAGLQLRMEEVDAESLVSRAAEAVNNIALVSDVNLRVEGMPSKFLGDEDRLLQVLLNLLTNAIGHSPKNSEVVLRVVGAEHNVTFQIVDEGAGLGDVAPNALFDEFVRLPNSSQRKGYGLGLAICRRVVAAHGGTITAKNNSDKGSTFEFSLPVEMAVSKPLVVL